VPPTVQTIVLQRPAVEATERGATELADAYWAQVRRLTRGLVRVRPTGRGPELRLSGVALFRFGPATTTVTPELVECRFAIVGGLLAKEEAGSLVFAQRTTPRLELEVSVTDYVPFLSSRRERRSLRRFVYRQLQERLHAAIGRRYLARMARIHA
jgi:hypothetical protein